MTHRIYAIRYDTREGRSPTRFFGGVDPRGDTDMPMDYFMWVAVDDADGSAVVIDTGFSESTASRRGRSIIRNPIDVLARIGVEPSAVQLVILTHLHFDHAGNLPAFPSATFVVQARELAFWRDPIASRDAFSRLTETTDLAALQSASDSGRVRVVEGDAEVVPGITVHLVGGHTPGLQVVRIQTASGITVLASDAAHFARNIDEDLPFSLVTHLDDMYRAFDRIRELAGPTGTVVPGHDPIVVERFAPASTDPQLEGVVVLTDRGGLPRPASP